MKLFVLLLFMSVTFSATSQNVGINKINPSEALDVNGNVNISGTLKANGLAGSSGQILMSTGAGLSWGSAMGFKKCVQFYSAGTSSWTVPAGVAEIMVELWGGGSGGTGAVGGTSGGYGRTVQAVTPGTVIGFSVGGGGTPGGASSSFSGGITLVNFPIFSIRAVGGNGVSSSLGGYQVGATQSGSISAGSTDNAFFMFGNIGTANAVTFGLSNASTYVQIINYGSGGAPVGMLNTNPVHGDIIRLDNGSTVGTVYSSPSNVPSAGGPAGQGTGWRGADGMVLFWFN